MQNALHERIDVTLVPEGSPFAERIDGEIVLDPEGDDPPDQFTPPYVDVGRIVEELFTLALDAYPRVPGAVLSGDAEDKQVDGPFAALQALRTDSAD